MATNKKLDVLEKSQETSEVDRSLSSPRTTDVETGSGAATSLGFQFENSEFEEAVLEVLNDFAYAHQKEAKVTDQENPKPVAQAPLKNERLKTKVLEGPGALMGIIGPCLLPKHIAHFYNINLDIETHVQNEDDFVHPRFLQAYQYLKSHPEVNIVMVYEKCFIAARSNDGRLDLSKFS